MSMLRGSGSGPRGRSRQSWSHQTLVSLPARSSTPARELSRRGLLALALLAAIVALVYFDRDAYTDNYDGSVTLIDAIYYATVTITTTGYGDITPITPTARILNAILVTPMRILFLVLLVGTTLEVLANEGRRMMRDNRWVASLWVSDDEPRQWSSEDVSLLETVAERTWAIVEKLRIDTEPRGKLRGKRQLG